VTVRTDTEQSHRTRIEGVLAYIEERLDDDLELDELARVAGFSGYHFHRIFKGLVGESVARYVRRLRLERAAFRLRHATTPVVHLALEAGYDSHEAFTRAFRGHFGVAPSRFRAHGGVPAPVPPAPASGDPSRPDRIEFRAPRRVAVLRHVGPYLDSLATWERLLAWAERRGLPRSDRMAGICRDDPDVTPAHRLRYDACLLLDEREAVEPGEGDPTVRELPGGRFAVFRHEGPYEELAALYESWLGGWLPRSGYEARDVPCLELYHRSPFDTGDPRAYETDVLVPVERARR